MHLFEINREERHFGFLFLAALISNVGFRKRIFEIINTRSNLRIKLSPDKFDIYAEVAIFRDYWNSLGSHLNYTEELHKKRFGVLKNIFEAIGLETKMIVDEGLFWTGEIGRSKLWYPGKWEKNKIEEVESKYEIKDQRLWRCRWLCNAKPDVMIQSENDIVFIEIKVESGMGTTEEGYDQEQTQKDIILAGNKTIDWMKQSKIERTTLTQTKFESGMTWDEIIKIYEENRINREIGNEMISRHLHHFPKKKNTHSTSS